MTREEMKSRTKTLANWIVRRCADLPGNWVARTSVGANYRAVCRANSNADFNKLRVVEEEANESLFWMELLVDNDRVKPARLGDLVKEADEILTIVIASAKTAGSLASRKS